MVQAYIANQHATKPGEIWDIALYMYVAAKSAIPEYNVADITS
jgi:hypothetical protein